jgi:homoserine kinase type II
MDVPVALRSWGLDAAAIEEVTSGSVNRVFRAVTTRGRVYLRVYRTKERDTVVREHALIRHVAGAGLPAVLPIPADGGDTVVMLDGTPCALYPEARGTQVRKRDLDLAHAVQGGDMLGRLHQCLAGVPDTGFRNFKLRWPGSAWVERLAGIARVIRERRSATEADERVLQRIHDQCAWLSDPDCPHEYQPTFDPQVIHGDYQHANLFFDSTGVSGVIDWEQGAFMPRGFEVARAAAYMFDVAREPTRAFLDAYRAVTGIGDEELDDGARAWGCMSDHYVWALEEVYLHGNERARPFIPERFRPFHIAWQAAKRS